MQKIYADKKKMFRYFKVGEHIFLKGKLKRSSIRLACCQKLAVRYCRTFEILEKIGPVAYMLAFPASMKVHNVFHVSLLNKYVADPNHIIKWIVIQEENEGDFRVKLVRILDQKVKLLRNKSIGLVKVQWNFYGPKDATWEHEETKQEEYLQYFVNFEENRS
jgi:hypothetical protein